MKPYYLLLLLACCAVKAQIVNIPDPAFKALLLSSSPTSNVAFDVNNVRIKIDVNNDGEIQETEAMMVYRSILFNSFYNVTDITGIDAFQNLTLLDCSYNHMTSVDVSGLPNLKKFVCNNIVELTAITLPSSGNIEWIECNYGSLTALNINGLNHLTYLACHGNDLISLTIGGNTMLERISCYENNLPTLDVSSATNLKYLFCEKNALTSLYVNNLHNLKEITCSYNELPAIDFAGLTAIETIDCTHNAITNFVWNGITNLRFLNCSNNPGITSLTTVGMTHLWILDCTSCNLSTLNVSEATNLVRLYCPNNQLTTLDLTAVHPREVICANNQLTQLLFKQNSSVENFDCSHNLLTQLNLPNTATTDADVDCSYNQLISLDASGLSLDEFDCSHNMLTSLNCQKADYLTCSNNQFESLHLEAIPFLELVAADNPNLHAVFMKNNTEGYASLTGNPVLEYICADPVEMADLESHFFDIDLSDIEVNSYCENVSGPFYYIEGQQKFDAATDGCSEADIAFPNLTFNITNGTSNGIIICDASGSYTIPVQAGMHTISPILENPTYFNVSPASSTISFPAQLSPVNQNFCITPAGIHPDVEATIYNLNTAVPGFDAAYRIEYKNKGNTIASGQVSLSYNGDTLDFVSSNPEPNMQSTGSSEWEYTNLLPFETRTINIILNLNSPVETPPLNQDDILTFTANISLAADEMPANNATTLNQTVFNAFDPNDKTCLEGDKINPGMIGEYVHYRIRFENTGNYPAQIITVKDVIDTSKFDISTLTPITASHPFITRITNTNQVEFVFDNIMLPYDDANNEGYVIFKIKTKPTLVLGDELSNTAGIYFNYNPPVTTNTAITTVAIPLSTDENENTFGFALYPNPVKDVLNISSKVNANINTIMIYNTLGQEVMKVIPAQGDYSIDVSRLPVGGYVLKVSGETLQWCTKFAKQ